MPAKQKGGMLTPIKGLTGFLRHRRLRGLRQISPGTGGREFLPPPACWFGSVPGPQANEKDRFTGLSTFSLDIVGRLAEALVPLDTDIRRELPLDLISQA